LPEYNDYYISKLRTQQERLLNEMSSLYLDKKEGLISRTLFNTFMSTLEAREQAIQKAIKKRIELETADKAYYLKGLLQDIARYKSNIEHKNSTREVSPNYAAMQESLEFLEDLHDNVYEFIKRLESY
jgi:hypothetical protein